MTDAFAGIDVSESGLTVAIHQSDYRFECLNDPASFDQLIAQLKGIEPKLIALEAGKRDALPLAAALHAASLPAALFDSAAVTRQAHKASDTRADALARVAAGARPRPASSFLHANEINRLLARRAQLIELLERERESGQSSELTTRREINSHIFEIEKRIAGVDFELRRY